jgi:hypothetical protein
MVPLGEFTKRGSFMASMGTLCILTNMLEIKVCEAPESKRMVTGVEWTLNVPSIISGSVCAVLVDT